MIFLSILVFLVIFSSLVLVHEGGHFFAAKKVGVTVEEFGLGFGKKIWGKMYKGTEFTLNLIPFGGFVRMLGEESQSEAPGSFEKAPLWGRMLITIAGVSMNWVFAIILLTLLFWHGSFPILVSETDVKDALAKGFIVENVDEKTGKKTIDFKEKIQLPFYKALPFAAVETFRISQAVLIRVSQIPGEVIRKRTIPEGLTGPVGIAEVTHQVLPKGIWAILKLTALLSISLATMNLLPIPALDGGRLLLQIFELIFRSKPNEAWEQRLHWGGFVFLLGFLLVITFHDLWTLFF